MKKSFFFGCMFSVIAVMSVDSITVNQAKTKEDSIQSTVQKIQDSENWTLSKSLSYQVVTDSANVFFKSNLNAIACSLPESSTSPDKNLVALISNLEETGCQWTIIKKNSSYEILIKGKSGNFKVKDLNDLQEKIKSLV